MPSRSSARSASELSAGKVDLPSFPEIAVRVRRILSDPNSSVDQVVRVVGSEPALSARLMRIANSASLNRSGKAVTDLRTAINRIGHNMVRSASISFAMAQIRKSNKLAGLEDQLKQLWNESTSVAALSFVLARTLHPRESRRGPARRHDARHRQARMCSPARSRIRSSLPAAG